MGSNPAGVKDFSLILVIISSFFFQAEWPGGNYVGQYCSLLALLHTLKCLLFHYRVLRGTSHYSCLSSSTAMFTVCIHGLGTILRRPCVSILSWGRIYSDIQRLSEFAFFSRNKSDKKDKLSRQSLNITSSSNAIVQILYHTITLFVTPVRINRGSR